MLFLLYFEFPASGLLRLTFPILGVVYISFSAHLLPVTTSKRALLLHTGEGHCCYSCHMVANQQFYFLPLEKYTFRKICTLNRVWLKIEEQNSQHSHRTNLRFISHLYTSQNGASYVLDQKWSKTHIAVLSEMKIIKSLTYRNPLSSHRFLKTTNKIQLFDNYLLIFDILEIRLRRLLVYFTEVF